MSSIKTEADCACLFFWLSGHIADAPRVETQQKVRNNLQEPTSRNVCNIIYYNDILLTPPFIQVSTESHQQPRGMDKSESADAPFPTRSSRSCRVCSTHAGNPYSNALFSPAGVCILSSNLKEQARHFIAITSLVKAASLQAGLR